MYQKKIERNGILFPKIVFIFCEKSFLFTFLLFYLYLLFFRMAFMISARLFWRLWWVWYHFWNENWLTHCHMLWPQHWLIFHRHWWKMLSMFFAGISFLLQSPMSTTQGFIDLSKLNSFCLLKHYWPIVVPSFGSAKDKILMSKHYTNALLLVFFCVIVLFSH